MSQSAEGRRPVGKTLTERPVPIDLRSLDVRPEQTLTPTAGFWLDNLERFDPRHEGRASVVEQRRLLAPQPSPVPPAD